MVAWNSVFSKPRLVRKLEVVPPRPAPKPEPLACNKITVIKTMETRIWQPEDGGDTP